MAIKLCSGYMISIKAIYSSYIKALTELHRAISHCAHRHGHLPREPPLQNFQSLSNISFFPPSHALSRFMTVTSSKVSFGDACLVMRVEP